MLLFFPFQNFQKEFQDLFWQFLQGFDGVICLSHLGERCHPVKRLLAFLFGILFSRRASIYFFRFPTVKYRLSGTEMSSSSKMVGHQGEFINFKSEVILGSLNANVLCWEKEVDVRDQ
jgi:hypothetical protein